VGIAAARELLWGFRGVSRETRCWRRRALSIPDKTLREDALKGLGKRGNIEGAAFFWILPDNRSLVLLKALIAYEIVADFLDEVSERGACAGIANGRQLHRALIDALDYEKPISSYYCYHESQDDGGFLLALVDFCRQSSRSLPSYDCVRSQLICAASHTQVLGINHEPDIVDREAKLMQWAESQFPRGEGLWWFELTAAASAWLTVLALLALAATPECSDQSISSVYAAYLRISLAGTMLDSYVDLADDAAKAAHSYFGYYPSMDIAVKRTGSLIQQSMCRARELGNGTRHEILVAAMVALYLSTDCAGARTSPMATRRLLQAGGPLVQLLLPALQVWQTLSGRGAT
jgi:tetraprenyl-beta-curcumene synthase